MTDTIEDIDALRTRARTWIEANLEPKSDGPAAERTRDEEKALHVIWRTRVDDGKLLFWQLLEDTVEHRKQLGLGPSG